MAATAAKTFKFPKEMGKCADMLYALREKRLAGQKVVDAVEDEEKALKEHIINNLPKSEASGILGKLAKVTVTNKLVPQVKDWEAFYAHIKKTNGFDLLNRALNKSAVEARYEAGKKVPGVESFNAVSVSCTKI